MMCNFYLHQGNGMNFIDNCTYTCMCVSLRSKGAKEIMVEIYLHVCTYRTEQHLDRT